MDCGAEEGGGREEEEAVEKEEGKEGEGGGGGKGGGVRLSRSTKKPAAVAAVEAAVATGRGWMPRRRTRGEGYRDTKNDAEKASERASEWNDRERRKTGQRQGGRDKESGRRRDGETKSWTEGPRDE